MVIAAAAAVGGGGVVGDVVVAYAVAAVFNHRKYHDLVVLRVLHGFFSNSNLQCLLSAVAVLLRCFVGLLIHLLVVLAVFSSCCCWWQY